MSIFTLNRVELIGNIGAEPEFKNVGSEAKLVAKINIATTESYKDQSGNWIENTDWHKVIMWNKLAERAEKTLHKGSKVYISGKLKTRSYEQDGVTKYATEIIADNFILFENRENPQIRTDEETDMYNSQTNEPYDDVLF